MDGRILLCIADILKFLNNLGVIKTDGTFDFPSDPSKEAQLAQGIERILVSYGVAVPARVNKIIDALPLILEIFS